MSPVGVTRRAVMTAGDWIFPEFIAGAVNDAHAAAASPLVVNKPAGAAAGDLVTAFVLLDAARVPQAEAGWTLEASPSGLAFAIGFWSRILDGTEGASFSFDWTGGAASGYGITLLWRKANPADPVGEVVTAGPATDADGNLSAPSITPATTPGLSLTLHAKRGSPGSAPAKNPPAGMVEILDVKHASLNVMEILVAVGPSPQVGVASGAYVATGFQAVAANETAITALLRAHQ